MAQSVSYKAHLSAALTTALLAAAVGLGSHTALAIPSCNDSDPYVICNVQDLENINNDLAGRYVLGQDLDASGFAFTPIGTATSSFSGTFDGNGHVIEGLTITQALERADGNYYGLFATSSGIIQNVSLSDETVIASVLSHVGGLVGQNIAGTIQNVSISGRVNASSGDDVGGLVGLNAGTIDQAHSTASVTAFRSGVGGLVGVNSGGTISNASSAGAVSGSGTLGGLVGGSAGGGSITRSYATGNVTSTTDDLATAGGLVGSNGTGLGYVTNIADIISQSFATGSVSGVAGYLGGLVGYNDTGHVVQSYSTGAVSNRCEDGCGTFSTVGGLVGYYGAPYSPGSIDESYAVGHVHAGGGSSGGVVGGMYYSGAAIGFHNYWDVQTTGQSYDFSPFGSTGLTTAQLQSGTLPPGFDPAVWTASPGQYPQLLWQLGFKPVPVGVLPIAQTITLPISALPPPSDPLIGATQFEKQYGPQLPSDTDQYLKIALLQTPLVTLDITKLKAEASAQALTLKIIADGLDVASSLPAGKPVTNLNLIAQGLSDTSKLADIILKLSSNSNSNAGLAAKLSNATGSFALGSVSCLTEGPFKCVASTFSFVTNHFIVPALLNFAGEDPPDSDYQSIFVLSPSILIPVVSTGDPTLDASTHNALYELELSGAYLFAVNISANRYALAIAANDATSAVVQLEAALHYLALYDSAVEDARIALASLLSLPQLQPDLVAVIDPSDFLDLQQDTRMNGFPPDEILALVHLGFDQVDIDLLANKFALYNPDLSSTTNLDTLFAGLDTSLQAVSPSKLTSQVPEPCTASMLLISLFGLFWVRRPRELGYGTCGNSKMFLTYINESS